MRNYFKDEGGGGEGLIKSLHNLTIFQKVKDVRLNLRLSRFDLTPVKDV